MAYRLPVDEPIEEGVRRVATEQIDRALADLAPEHPDRDAAVHDARRRVKRVRALIRLVRPRPNGQVREEDARLREAARRLSPARDAAVTIQTYDAVLDRFSPEVERRAFGPIRRALTIRYQDIVAEGSGSDLVGPFRQDLLSARQAVLAWKLDSDGFDAVAVGLRGTYRDGRRAMSAAYRKSSRKRFHAWRRHVRYHALHMALLRDVWVRVVNSRWKEVDRLGEMLGAEHDLAVLTRVLKKDTPRFGGAEAHRPFRALLRRRRGELQALARPLGRRVHAERPGALVNRFGRYWDARFDESAP